MVQFQHLPSDNLPDELEITRLARTIYVSLEAAGHNHHATCRANRLLQFANDFDVNTDPLDYDYCMEVTKGLRVNYVGHHDGPGNYGGTYGQRRKNTHARGGGRGCANNRRRAP